MIELFKEVITVNECEVFGFIPFAPAGVEPEFCGVPSVEDGFETDVIL